MSLNIIYETATHKMESAGVASPPELDMRITPHKMIVRLGDDYASLDLASIDDPSATQSERLQKANIRRLLKELELASYVELDKNKPDGQRNYNSLIALEQAGLIGVGRTDEIFDTPIQQDERP